MCNASHILVSLRVCEPRNDVRWQKEGNEECCSEEGRGLCKIGDGDCDRDSDCEGDLVCGRDNCPWGDRDDCCMEPGKPLQVTFSLWEMTDSQINNALTSQFAF